MNRFPNSIVCIAIAVVFLISSGMSCGFLVADEPVTSQPNIVLINLDDADSDLLCDTMLTAYYPNIKSLADNGIRFTNVHATTPFCAPSRAALMRGQYAFNTGIKANQTGISGSNGFTGGYGEFVARGHHNDELGVWMKNAGYRTMHVGKYHHHEFDSIVPPGWDDFVFTAGANYYNTAIFSNIGNPQGIWYSTGENDYITDVITADSTQLITNHHVESPDQPFFLYLAPLTPHHPFGRDVTTMVGPQYQDFAPLASLPMAENFNEADFSDKPAIQNLPLLSPSNIQTIEDEYISRVRAIKSIDDMLGTLIETLTTNEQLDNTYIVLTSDNGYQLGQHRMRAKLDPYDSTTRVPLFVMGPNVDAALASHLIAHIDLCPTILELANAPIPEFVDAKSFLSVINDPAAHNEADWQSAIMIENWNNKTTFNTTSLCTYTSLRLPNAVYISWASGDQEYYDLMVDPLQLNNSYDDLSIFEQDALESMLVNFRGVSGNAITTITTPSMATIMPQQIELDGFCEDDSGVKDVLINISSHTTGRFWNGTSWQDEYINIHVTPAAFGKPISQWHLSQEIPTETENGIDYLVFTARTIDLDNNVPFNVEWIMMVMDGELPVANFDSELLDGMTVPEGDVSLYGTQSDNLGMAEVRLVVIDTSNWSYWNGTQFQSSWTYVDTNFDESTDLWDANLDVPPGNYLITLRPIDLLRNQPAVPEFLFIGVDEVTVPDPGPGPDPDQEDD